MVEDSELIKTRPKAQTGEYLIYDGRHEGIISEDLFNAAQEKQGRNPRTKADTKIRNPFASLLYCQCGKAMIYRTYTKRGQERSSPRLLCGGQSHCQTPSCLYDELLNRVCIILKEFIADFEIKLKNEDENSVKLHNQMIRTLEKKLIELEAKELSQWEAQSDPDPANRMPAAIFKQLNEKLLREKQEVQQSLQEARETMPNPTIYQEKIARFQAALSALQNPEVDAQTKNNLLKACIEKIEYSRERSEKDHSVKPSFTISVHLKT